MSSTVMIIALLLMAFGIVLGLIGALGFSGRLRRNRFVGIRTPATLRSDEAFVLANRVGGFPIMLGGGIALLGGIASRFIGTSTGQWIMLTIGFCGAAALTIIGGITGARAAEMLTLAESAGQGCTGCACGGCSN